VIKAISYSETSVNIYEATWHSIPEDSNVSPRRCESLKSHFQHHVWAHFLVNCEPQFEHSDIKRAIIS
jgi:hypothetical protein